MKIQGRKLRVLSVTGFTAAILGMTGAGAWAADFTSLDVEQDIDFGTTASPATSAVRLSYWPSTFASRVDLTPNNGTFVWRDNAGADTKMKLDESNVLSLFTSATTPVATISLSPNSGQINLSGTGSGIYSNGSAVFTLNSSGNMVFANRPFNFSSTTASTSSSTGALTVAGGLGVATDSFINGIRIGRAGGNNITNLALGYLGLNSNTSGTSNTATGYGVLAANTSGSCNTGAGRSALEQNISGNHNSAAGFAALWSNTTGSYNVAVGDDAGRYLVNGQLLTDPENSIYIGANSRGLSNSDDNSIVIGTSALGEGANTTVIGTSSTTSTHLFGQTKTSSLSVTGASATGSLNVTGASTSGSLNVTGASTTSSLNVTGASTNGSLSVTGATVLSGSVTLAAPQGDISMGDFAN